MPKVQAYVYDITQGMAARMSPMLLGKTIDIVPHTGIVVFGKEYFFGSGPCVGEPGKSVPVPTSQILDLGETSKTCEELEAYIQGVLAKEHTSENYNLLSHNCNHYANDVAKFLLDGKGIPESIVNIAEEALSTPQGQSLRVMIEKMEAGMRSNMGGGSALNPFGDVGSGSAAAPAMPAAAGAVDPELEAALTELSKQPVDEKRAALAMLLKLSENAEKNPAEPKFRRIKMANAVFTKKIGGCSGGVEALIAAGWVPDTNADGEDVWLLDDAAVARQSGPRVRFAQELAKLPAAPAPAAPRQDPVPMPAADPFGGMGGGYGGGGMPGMPGGLPGGMNPAMMQQMMQNNPQMAQMMNNPAMMQQAQQMMQDPTAMAQVQQMMQNPQMMAQMQNMMGGMGRGGGGFGGF
mmetsp:Transcript_25169/g.63872  ORF Transcript_25169/g.63872 Transcript_25169/m.63872 type:complete len:407 (-) Transcript_25169:54-1274(-)